MKIYNFRIRSSVHGQTNLCTLGENQFNFSVSELNGICAHIVTIIISHILECRCSLQFFMWLFFIMHDIYETQNLGKK